MKSDTIAAIATPMTNSGIGIIRISGPEAFSIIDHIYESKKGKRKLSEVESHTVHYGFIRDGENVLDEVMVLVLRAPNTYTKEDTVEIDCHGGVFVMRAILNTIIRHGARIAEPGEYTKRAFLNGRIDLSQAEAVMDLISSKNEYARKASVLQLRGKVAKQVKGLREDILYQIAFIESALDDPEHISLEGYSEKLSGFVEELLEKLDRLLKSADNGRVIAEGIKTVIIGKPNVGKSSLLNLLVGEERAIVTDVAGTTRDVLTEHIILGGISLNLMDTAGIRDTEDVVEKIGVEKAKSSASDADLLIFVVDSSIGLDENDKNMISFIQDKRSIVLLNKTDLPSAVDKEMLEKLTKKQVISVSAKERTGIEELQNAVETMFLHGSLTYNDEVVITNVRHKIALEEAYESIQMVKKSVEENMPEDFYTIDLMNAYEQLGFIIGESLEDDLVNEIFKKFCTGK